jgi:hypothetical protein
MRLKKKISSPQVVSRSCNECLFSSNRIVPQERKDQIIQQTLAEDRYFTCHKAMIEGRDLCYRGFFDIHKFDSLVTRLAIQLNRVEFVDLNDLQSD